MKNILARSLALLLLVAGAAPALAQSSPGLVTGQVPTAAQWNSYFAAKQDVLGFTALSLAGGTMSGPLILNANPSALLGAATKQYVDAIAGTFVTRSGSVTAGNVAVWASSSSIQDGGANFRTPLSADINYFVRTDGSDANSCLANTAGGACLTIQGAWDKVNTNLDSRGHSVSINVADGTYTGATTISGRVVGNGSLFIVGNAGTPNNVILSSAGNTFTITGGAYVNIQGVKMSSSAGSCLDISAWSSVTISSYNFAGCSSYGAQVAIFSSLNSIGPFTISGGGAGVYHIVYNSRYTSDASVGTITGTPAFAAFFFGTSDSSRSDFSTTWSGAATGVKSFIHHGSIVASIGGGPNPDSYFPGSVSSGSLINGSYDDYWGGAGWRPQSSPGNAATGSGWTWFDATKKRFCSVGDVSTIVHCTQPDPVWLRYNGTTSTITASSGISGAIKNATGNYTFNFSTSFTASTTYAATCGSSSGIATVTGPSAGQANVFSFNLAGAATDGDVSCSFIGLQ